LSVSIDPALYSEIFGDESVNKSRVVQEALALYRREALRREIERFCATPDASDIQDAERALPAQREALDRD
jgi:hypothetical protein